MSRIGKAPISVPEGVEINISDDNVVSVKGKIGELQQQMNKDMIMKLEDGTLTIERPSESKEHKAQHGLVRSLLNNMIIGVSEGRISWDGVDCGKKIGGTAPIEAKSACSSK